MYLGDLVEMGETEQIFFKPKRREPKTTSQDGSGEDHPGNHDTGASKPHKHLHQFDSELQRRIHSRHGNGRHGQMQIRTAVHRLSQFNDDAAAR
jgi:hypothetical protein